MLASLSSIGQEQYKTNRSPRNVADRRRTHRRAAQHCFALRRLYLSLIRRGVVQFGMKSCVVGHTCQSFARASLTSSLRSIAQVGDVWRIERTRVTNTLPHPVMLSESEESKLALGRTAAGSPRLRSLCFAAQRHVNPWGLVGRDFRCFAAAQHDRLARRVIRERARARPEIKYLLQWTTPIRWVHPCLETKPKVGEGGAFAYPAASIRAFAGSVAW